MKPFRAHELDCEATLIDAAIRGGWMVHGERTVQTSKGSHMTAIKGQKGFPDLTLSHPQAGTFLMVELKRAPNEVEPEQQLWLDSLRYCGITAEVWWVPEQVAEKIDYLLNHARRARRT